MLWHLTHACTVYLHCYSFQPWLGKRHASLAMISRTQLDGACMLELPPYTLPLLPSQGHCICLQQNNARHAFVLSCVHTLACSTCELLTQLVETQLCSGMAHLYAAHALA
jgi:hypothetical protein